MCASRAMDTFIRGTFTSGLLGIVVCYLRITFARSDDVNIALMLPLTGSRPLGKRMASAAQMAIDAINKDTTMLPNRTLKFLWNDTECSARKGLGEAVDLWAQLRDNLHAFIGPGCDVICESSGMLAAEWNVPMISWGCVSIHLSDKDTYPTLARTVGPHTKVSKMFRRIMEYYNWTRLGIAASTELTWQMTAHEIQKYLEEKGFNVAAFHSFDPGNGHISVTEKANHVRIMQDFSLRTRIIIICASGGDVREMMLTALDQGLVDGNYVFFTIDILQDAVKGINTWMGDDGRDADAEIAFNAIMNIHHQSPHTTAYANFEKEVRSRMKDAPFFLPMNDLERVDVHAGLLYDAFYLYAYALNDTLQENHSEHDGKIVASKMFNRSFLGISGEVIIDQYGDRDPNYALQDYQNAHFEDFADYNTNNDNFTIREHVKVIYPGGKMKPPLDHPRCGWNNEYCPDNTMTAVIASVVSILVLMAAGFGVFTYFYRKMRLEAELKAHDLWQIKFEDIVIVTGRIRTKSMLSFPSRQQLQSQQLRSLGSGSFVNSIDKSEHERLSVGGQSVISSQATMSKSQMFTEVGIYKGNYVAMKKIHRKSIQFTREVLLELKEVRDMQDENVNAFIGACTEYPDIYIITQYCTKGSLQDVLENEDIKITDQFKMSFAADICKGMTYIHNSSLGSHGRLKSSNCVIDSRWVCKITDFGLEHFKSGQEIEMEDYTKYRNLLWTAPELLRAKDPPYYGTPKADVYSFGIILQEIILRGGPYVTQMMNEPKDIVTFVSEVKYPPYRPKVPSDSCEQKLHNLMRTCWAEDPDDRPTFQKIKSTIRRISGNKSTNLVDNMIKMMEQYADHLEELVDDRTKQLEEEKKKTDQLLHQMLPKVVADKLKLGEQVLPEHYQEVTVYFSDIVAFTKLASESTPLQVVNLLNDLYTCFDAIIDNYVCYKVETIGDAYMVVSGIPERSVNVHATEIATMALDILSSLTDFKIRHKPGKQLQLRSGIHTGPVVAGVVGLKMPRYCLFGDTVNTASRMESSSYALRIHVSPNTQSVLAEIGGFHLAERGKVSMKGKEDMTTYWLQGKDGFEKPLPDLALALPLSEHNIK
ncbi:atrial natriuretic peptide receptor 1-like isoform X2 [Lineus longissimus]|uniref:atrial natriuretic peptide receptor 1-like isoform X2 n=1 Tax=Lineus longissimus TaxID=88925 RepID=UPI002B4CD7F1